MKWGFLLFLTLRLPLVMDKQISKGQVLRVFAESMARNHSAHTWSCLFPYYPPVLVICARPWNLSVFQ